MTPAPSSLSFALRWPRQSRNAHWTAEITDLPARPSNTTQQPAEQTFLGVVGGPKLMAQTLPCEGSSTRCLNKKKLSTTVLPESSHWTANWKWVSTQHQYLMTGAEPTQFTRLWSFRNFEPCCYILIFELWIMDLMWLKEHMFSFGSHWLACKIMFHSSQFWLSLLFCCNGPFTGYASEQKG